MSKTKGFRLLPVAILPVALLPVAILPVAILPVAIVPVAYYPSLKEAIEYLARVAREKIFLI